MSSWPMVALNEVCDVVSGGTPKTNEPSFWGGDIPWVTPKDLSGLKSNYIDKPARFITAKGLRSSSAALLPAESVLLSSRAPIGLLAINAGPIATNQGFKSLVPNRTKLDSLYLIEALKFRLPDLLNQGNGATFKEVSKSTVERFEIPLPPLHEQKRFSTLLGQANTRVKKESETIDILEGLGQILFARLISTSTSVNFDPLIKLGKISTGKTPPTADSGNFGEDFPFVTPGDLESGKPVGRFLSRQGQQLSKTVRQGSALVCCIGATIGKVGFAHNECAFNQQINAVEWGDTIHPVYGYYALRASTDQIKRAATSTTLPILNKSNFGRVNIPVLPLEEQREFAEQVRLVQNVRKKAVARYEVAQELYASLQYRTFRGNL